LDRGLSYAFAGSNGFQRVLTQSSLSHQPTPDQEMHSLNIECHVTAELMLKAVDHLF